MYENGGWYIGGKDGRELLRKAGGSIVSVQCNCKVKKHMIIKIVCCLLAVISVAATEIDYEIAAETGMGMLSVVLISLQGWGIVPFLMVILLGIIYYYILLNYAFQKDIAVFALLLSLFMVLGLCYRNATGIVLAVSNISQILKTAVVIIGYSIMFYSAIFFLQRWLYEKMRLQKTEEKIDKQAHYKMKVGLFLFICWLPYLIVLYPGTALFDAGTMLEQYFGYAPLTNHHPYFQILFLGFFVKVGCYLGSAAVGMFLYILLQECAFIAVLAYMMELFCKLKIRKKIRCILLLLYAFLPVFPVYALSAGKNINFAIVVLLLIIFMFELLEFEYEFIHNRKKVIMLPILLLLICLFRNEGLALVIGCFPCFLVIGRKHWKMFFGIFAGVFLFIALWFKIILPTAGVANGSIAESLSVPFMQTARTVAYYGTEMTEEEIEAIDCVLEFDTLPERYLPEFSDRVKEKYNNDATEEEIRAYLKVYWKQLIEHPVTYIDAFLNKCYGYVYPDDKGKTKAWFVVGADIYTLNEDGFNLKSRFPDAVKMLDDFLEAFRNIPMLGYTTSIGFYVWCMFLAMFFWFKSRKKKRLLLYVPELIVLLVCVASPVNAYFRYGLPIVFAVPFFVAITVYIIGTEREQFCMRQKRA